MIDLWENIKTFYLIVKFNSFKETAIYLNLNPSTVSRHIKQLEDVLNIVLFENKYPIVLSEHGRRLFTYIDLPCQNLLNLQHFKQTLNKNTLEDPFTLYFNDTYFFHLLLKIYDCKLVKESLSFSNISLNNNDQSIIELMKKQKSNFIYVTIDENFIKKLSSYPDYIFWPIYDIPICYYFTQNICFSYLQFICYTGQLKWLEKMHRDYIAAHKISETKITNSNSIEVIFDLLHCNGQSILPGIQPNTSNSNAINNTHSIYSNPQMKSDPLSKTQRLQSKQVGSHKLFFVCHSSDVFLKLVF